MHKYPYITASITGLAFSLIESGSVQLATTSAKNCANSLATAYQVASSATCTTNLGTDISGMSFFPGVYCGGTFSTAAHSEIVFDAQNKTSATWIFQASTTLMTGIINFTSGFIMIMMLIVSCRCWLRVIYHTSFSFFFPIFFLLLFSLQVQTVGWY